MKKNITNMLKRAPPGGAPPFSLPVNIPVSPTGPPGPSSPRGNSPNTIQGPKLTGVEKTTSSSLAQLCVHTSKMLQITEAAREASMPVVKGLSRVGVEAKKDEQTKALGEVYEKAANCLQKFEESKGELAGKLSSQVVDVLTDVLAATASSMSKEKDPLRNNQARQTIMLLDFLEAYNDFFTKCQETLQPTLATLRPLREAATAEVAATTLNLSSITNSDGFSNDDDETQNISPRRAPSQRATSPTRERTIANKPTTSEAPSSPSPTSDAASQPAILGVESMTVSSEKPQRAYDSQDAGPIGRAQFADFLMEEEKFCSQMGQIVEKFSRPFKDDEKLAIRIFEEDYENIFMHIEPLSLWSSSNVSDLQSFHRNWPMANPGAYFLQKINGFDLFINYATSYGSLAWSLRRAKKLSRSVKQYMFQTLIEPTQITLGLALQTPLKVIPRWFNFFDQLQLTGLDAIETKNFVTIKSKLRRLNSQLASQIENNDVILQIHDVQSRIQGVTEMFAQPGRRFIREGTPILKPDNVQVYLFLFNDMLVEARAPPKTLAKNLGKSVKCKFSRKIMLRRAHVADLASENAFKLTEGITNATYGFESQAAKASWVHELLQLITYLNRDTVFGIPLEELMTEREKGRDVPLIVEKTINFLIAKGLTTEGLFRVCGSQKRIDEIRDLFDTAQPVEFEADNEMEVHAVAGILKLWIRSLPAPLITFYDEFMDINRGGGTVKDKVPKIRAAVEKLPKYNKYLLQHLISFCVLISAHSESNKMTSSNISIVIGPNILYRGDKDQMDPATQVASIADQKDITDTVQNLIERYDGIFTEIEAERRREKQRQVTPATPSRQPPATPVRKALPPAPAGSLPAPPKAKPTS